MGRPDETAAVLWLCPGLATEQPQVPGMFSAGLLEVLGLKMDGSHVPTSRSAMARGTARLRPDKEINSLRVPPGASDCAVGQQVSGEDRGRRGGRFARLDQR